MHEQALSRLPSITGHRSSLSIASENNISSIEKITIDPVLPAQESIFRSINITPMPLESKNDVDTFTHNPSVSLLDTSVSMMEDVSKFDTGKSIGYPGFGDMRLEPGIQKRRRRIHFSHDVVLVCVDFCMWLFFIFSLVELLNDIFLFLRFFLNCFLVSKYVFFWKLLFMFQFQLCGPTQ